MEHLEAILQQQTEADLERAARAEITAEAQAARSRVRSKITRFLGAGGELVREEHPLTKRPPHPARALIGAICFTEGVRVADVMGPSATHRLARVRHRCWRELYALDDYTQAEIGSWFGVTSQAVTMALKALARADAAEATNGAEDAS